MSTISNETRTDPGREELAKRFRDYALDENSPQPPEVQQAAALARELMRRANELQTPQERRQQAELDRMMHNPNDKVTLTQMTDQAFRSNTPHRAVNQLVHILDVQGIPRFFTPVNRALLRGFQSFGAFLPGVAVPLVKDKMQHETANVILPAERELLTVHLGERRDEGVRMNVNYLGEALLGEGEAQNRLRGYLQALQMPEIEVISVKISTIFSQISALAAEHTLSVLCDRLEMLYRAAAKATFTRSDGTVVPKFVYLDMEEYRDMWLTAEAFMRTLDRPGLADVVAGIALQAYIPDAFRMHRRITEWARRRVEGGGAPVTVRIVKGANMEMERFEASVFGWPQAPYKSKLETDANYRRMVQYAMLPENLAAAHPGIASHNLFDLAYGIVLAVKNNCLPQVQIEMLEGMANHQRRALFELAKNLLLYAPACHQEDFIHAIGYLVRRLDENTGPDNFLRHTFRLKVDTPEWNQLEQQFFAAFEQMNSLSDAPRRTQNRRQPPVQPHPVEPPSEQASWHFVNEPDTDFSLPHNVTWAEQLVSRWEGIHSDNAVDIPLTIAGEEVIETRVVRECVDPSRPQLVIARYRQANGEDIQQAVACAQADVDEWRGKSAVERRKILRNVAHEIRISRADLMGAALADGGKTLPESDPEVSEAIDFLEFYSLTAEYWEQQPGLRATGRGVVVVVSPWNFPIAIPCGGIAAALAAGNTVILKPASDTVLVAHELCRCFWRAGVSQKTLQLIPCAGGTEGQQLASHHEVDTVILTGGTETALRMLEAKPKMRLLAETGGKNATIVTAMADRDQAIKNVLHSAFGHAGQKCSATSLLIMEEEVFNDSKLKESLCDAVRSLDVGSAWELKTKMGPLIRPPSGELETALKELEPGESWAVMPRRDRDNPHLYTPAVKWGASPGSFTHRTEFFGPVLAVMKAKDLDEAIDLVNATGYGLTSGLESLDDREQRIWKESIRAGNLYINRGTTGAIVLRQPFGGMGKSAFGPGIKAGGPNYVTQLMQFEESALPQTPHSIDDPHLSLFAGQLKAAAENPANMLSTPECDRILAAMRSYVAAHETEFGQTHDDLKLIGQDNYRRYLPVSQLRLRIHKADTLFDIIARVCAAKTVGCHITVSSPPGLDHPIVQWLDEVTEPWAAAIEFLEESDEGLLRAIATRATDRVRYAAADRVPDAILLPAAQASVYLADTEVTAHGRLELMWYVKEQSISDDYHRYGNLGARGEEERAPYL